MAELFGFDAYSPKEIAERVENIGVTKARLPVLTVATLGVLAGGFIGLGALYFTLVIERLESWFCRQPLAWRPDLFAGVDSRGCRRRRAVHWQQPAGHRVGEPPDYDERADNNWIIVYLANLAGALGLVFLVVLSHHWQMNSNAVGISAVKIAVAKAALPFWEAFFKGIVCNVLVCLAVWLALAGRSVTDKIFAVIFPISAFVAAGFEHSVANMYFIPLGILLKDRLLVSGAENLSWLGLWSNLVPVTLGNIMGGSVMVALVYYFVYRRGADKSN